MHSNDYHLGHNGRVYVKCVKFVLKINNYVCICVYFRDMEKVGCMFNLRN